MDNICKRVISFLSTLVYPSKERWLSRGKDQLMKNLSVQLTKEKVIEHLHTKRCRDYYVFEATKVCFLGNYNFGPLKDVIWQAKFHDCLASQTFIAELLSDELIASWTDQPLTYSWYSRPVLMHVPSTTSALKHKTATPTDHMRSIQDIMMPLLQSFISNNHQGNFLKVSPLWVDREIAIENKKLTRQRRIEGSVHKFQYTQSILAHMPIILLDDILTTGATMKDVKRALEAAGAIHIYSMVLAH